ncbi:DNA adenine methylase [Pseudidiomarina aestuarii]|uniref:DNA adenine methylase n=1 Tax=Pseudidiomarina aestuarii TaxID=624146 RepID=UPI003A979E73
MGYRYIGSKSKILDIVLNKIQKLAPVGSHITDLMTGTATVAIELRKLGYKVTANDLMTYSYHHAVTGLKFQRSPSFEGAFEFIENNITKKEFRDDSVSAYSKFITALNNSQPIKGYFWNEFSLDGSPKNTEKPRNYYSSENAAKIDGIRANITKLKEKNSLTNVELSLVLHDLIMGTNDIANIAGTYGHHMAKLSGRACDDLRLYTSDLLLLNDTENHTVLQGYAEDVSSQISCDVCYIDPPYMKRQYAANYHILETLARGDIPEAIGVSGLRPWRDQYSNFCTKTKIRDSFRKIFTNMKTNNFLISYSEDGLLHLEDFIELLTPYGQVEIDTFSHKRFKSNNSALKNELTEYLIHLQR